ncbi:MAG: alpha/beta hydrolase-fold protein [Bacteroidota bacterium]
MNSKLIINLIFLCFSLTGPLYSQGFSSFITKVNTANVSVRNDVALQYIASQSSIPVVESDSLVFFLYWGKAISVAVSGDASGWAPSLKMSHIEGSDLWYYAAKYDRTARLEYKIVVNERNWRLDSLNKNTIMGGMGPNSVLELPLYSPPKFVEVRQRSPAGRVFDTTFQSETMKEPRQLKIYLPFGYSTATGHYPIIFFFDGNDFFKFTQATILLDNMIADKRIPPVIAVFEQPVHRDAEYSGMLQGKFTDYIVSELVPFIDNRFRTILSADKRVLAGISNGGNIALWIGGTHPEVFGKVIAMSSNVENNVARAYEKGDPAMLKLYMNFGKYDMAQLIPRVNKLKSILEQKKYTFMYREYPEGHNWGFWQKYLPEAMEYLFL